MERFLAHLDAVSGGVEPEFSGFPCAKGPPVSVLTYRDVPEAGMLVGITYGLSLGRHPDWVAGRPELCIGVRSEDPAWAYALGDIAAAHRDEWPFCYGSTVDFHEPVSAGSPMSAFLLFAPAVLEREDYAGIDLGDDLPVNLTGMYPIHEVERQWVREHGLEAFWALDWEPDDVHRAPVV